MSTSDDDLFRQEMTGVTPLSTKPAAVPRRPAPGGLAEKARRQAAQARSGDPNPLTVPDHLRQVGPHDIVGLKKNGVQEGVYRKLRLGKYEVQARLDLHRVYIKDAREQVYRFIREASDAGLRTVMITHGKGHHSETPARMKSCVLHWLEELDLVLAFHSASPGQGGAGATCVLLRKSSAASQRTREHFTRGRS